MRIGLFAVIISHQHRFIFVKTAKVAGTSFELAMRPYLGPDDIATPVVAYDEKLAQELGLPGPCNFGPSYWYCMCNQGGKGAFNEHSWAYEIRGLLGSGIWDDYYTFTIERDPRDKSISNYYHYRNASGLRGYLTGFISWNRWRKRKKAGNVRDIYISPLIAKLCSLEAWLKIDREIAFGQNFLRYSADDEVIVDKVYAYDRLEELLDDMEKIVGERPVLPRAKAGFRKREKSYPEEVTRLLDELAMNPLYEKEIGVLAGFSNSKSPTEKML